MVLTRKFQKAPSLGRSHRPDEKQSLQVLLIRFEGVGFGKLFFRPAWNKSAFPQLLYVFPLQTLFQFDNGMARRTRLSVRHTPRCQSTASVNDICCATGFGKTNSMLAPLGTVSFNSFAS